MTQPAEIRGWSPRRGANSAASTSWSTTPASSTSPRSSTFPDERWDAVIAINLSAAFHATKAAMPRMIAKGWGRIINIASAHGLVASGEKAAYVAAKHGLVGLTKVMAIETGQPGHHLQRDLPRLGADRAGAAADRRARRGAGHPGREGARGPGAREAADAAITRRPRRSARSPYSCAATARRR